jgi:energy-coupling factor transporter transmembrane protein EcfT
MEPLLLHPSSLLATWFAVLVVVQSLDYPGLSACAMLLLLVPGVLRSWLAFVRRARWLLLTLWLILAYNTPGEAYADIAWAPTYEGVVEATVHAARLIVMLGCLSWLFVRLGRDGLLAGLWGVLQPGRYFGLDTERLVVRLSLVLESLQTPQEKGAWRKMLLAEPDFSEGANSIKFASAVWTGRDSLLIAGALSLLMVVVLF